MTLIDNIEFECSVCHQSSRQPVLMSTNSFGAPDLDLRPSEMQRSTMNTWIMECPHCGHVAPKLDDESKISEDFLKTDKYLNCDGFEFERDLAGRFFKGYLICKKTDNTRGCFFNLLYCAWVCDDANDSENAKKIRMLAIDYLDQLIQEDNDEKNSFLLMKADLLRRSGNFTQVVEEFKDFIIGDELLDRIVTFQVLKSRENDDACYTVKDVKYNLE